MIDHACGSDNTLTWVSSSNTWALVMLDKIALMVSVETLAEDMVAALWATDDAGMTCADGELAVVPAEDDCAIVETGIL